MDIYQQRRMVFDTCLEGQMIDMPSITEYRHIVIV